MAPYSASCSSVPSERAVFFDLDGTLVDTSSAILRSLNFASESLGFKGVKFDRALIGLPVREIFAKAIAEANAGELDALRDGFRKHHDHQMLIGWSVYKGVPTTLELLIKFQIPYFIVTSRPRSGVLSLFHSGFSLIPLDRYFCVGEYGSFDKSALLNHLILSQTLSPDQCLSFGDQVGDAVAADANGIPSFFCEFGFGCLGANIPNSTKVVRSHMEICSSIRNFYGLPFEL